MQSELRELLEGEKLAQYIQLFEQNGINDLTVFSELDQNDLKDMGMTVLGDRKRVMLAIKKLSTGGGGGATGGGGGGTASQMSRVSNAEDALDGSTSFDDSMMVQHRSSGRGGPALSGHRSSSQQNAHSPGRDYQNQYASGNVSNSSFATPIPAPGNVGGSSSPPGPSPRGSPRAGSVKPLPQPPGRKSIGGDVDSPLISPRGRPNPPPGTASNAPPSGHASMAVSPRGNVSTAASGNLTSSMSGGLPTRTSGINFNDPTSPRGKSPQGSPRPVSSATSSPRPGAHKLLFWQPEWFTDADYKTPDLAHQAIATGSATEDSSAIYRDAKWPHFLVKTFRSDVMTLWDNFCFTVKHVPKSNFLATRSVSTKLGPDGEVLRIKGKYVWESYQQIYQEVSDLARGLAVLGFGRAPGIGIFAKNRKEYVVIELASYALGGYNTAIYDTFGPEAALYVINHSDITVLMCTAETLPQVRSFLRETQKLRLVVCADPITTQMATEFQAEVGAASRILLCSYDDVIIKGKNSVDVAFYPPSSEDTACIMYTSGTTGMPKGVVLSHGNFMASVCGMLMRITLVDGDRFISYLPLSHVLERSVLHAVICMGAEMGFYSGDVKQLVDDIQELKPTIVPGVPRIYERIYAAITSRIAGKSGLAQRMFNRAFFASQKAIRSGKKPPALWDKTVFSKIKKNLGGNVRMLFSGGAPLNKRTQEYLSIVFACPLVQGYGLTETCGAACASYLEDSNPGHNGPPLAHCEMKLMDCPEMNYFHLQTPPTGEICVRGPTVTRGYFKEPAQTKDVIDEQGWFHTGDIGRFMPNGTFQIIDRKKNIFKLSQGLYIAAEALEGMYALSPFVSQIWIPGDSTKSYLVAVVVPAEPYCKAWAEEFGLDSPMEELCKTPELHEVVLRDLQLIHKENQRPGYELLKGIILESEEWAPDTGLTSPTLKLKRPALRSKYAFRLKQLYDSLDEKGVE